MAIRSAWWMREPVTTQLDRASRRASSTTHNLHPYRKWPSQAPDGLSFNELERYLHEHPGTHCSIYKLSYSYDAGGNRAKWGRNRKAKSTDELNVFLTEQASHLLLIQKSGICIISSLSAEALQMLGYYLNITPRFFNFPYVISSTGVPVKDFAFFGLQIMEKYSLKSIPTEAQRSSSSPRMIFRNKGGPSKHTWHVTRINVAFIRSTSERPYYHGVIVFDPADQAFVDALLALAVKVEEDLPGLQEHKIGLCDTLTKVFYIIGLVTSANAHSIKPILKQRAEASIALPGAVSLKISQTAAEVLIAGNREQNQKCVEEDLSSEDQLAYTRELHKLVPLFSESRRRIFAAKDVTQQMLDHPFFTSVNAHHSMTAYLQKTMAALDEYKTRSLELSEQTNNLISLIFNIATLQDTRVAVEESRAANILAASIRRVTVLTFIYLPLMLSASIFGMNVFQITEDKSNPSVWIFIVVAAVMMLFTIGVWTMWSRMLDDKQRRRYLRTIINGGKAAA
ncbi:hypothetical protein BDR22DRAFT_971259 [Usnea florida]